MQTLKPYNFTASSPIINARKAIKAMAKNKQGVFKTDTICANKDIRESRVLIKQHHNYWCT